METREKVIKVREPGRHATDRAIVFGQLLNTLPGVVHFVGNGNEFVYGRRVTNSHDFLFCVIEHFDGVARVVVR